MIIRIHLLALGVAALAACAGSSQSPGPREPREPAKTGPSPSPSPSSSVLPLERGMVFEYRGVIRWHDRDAGEDREEPVRWTMEVVDEIERPPARAWVVRGFPLDLVEPEPAERKPETWLIVRIGKRYYLSRDTPELRATLTPEPRDLWFALPLGHGQRLCPDPEAPEHCWEVSARGASFELIFRTGPDHIRYLLVPGKGIAEFVYGHHGTTLDVTLELVNRP